MTDLACDWTLDGTPQVRLVSGKPAKVAVSLGKHLINATTVDGIDNIETIVEASRPQQEILKLDLNAVRADRLASAGPARLHSAIIGGLPTNAHPPLPPPPSKPKPPASPIRVSGKVQQEPETPAAPIRVGGNVVAPNLIKATRPVYPPLAKLARAQGTVKLEATISKDGTIENLHLLSGPPLLVQAAMEAVQQWQYKPTIVNGEPVEVLTTIDVNFSLSN
jgi:TonB family protein